MPPGQNEYYLVYSPEDLYQIIMEEGVPVAVVSDEVLAALVPIIVYWLYSGFYLMLGSCEAHRFHPSSDHELSKNLVSKSTVVKGVLLQQLVQAAVATTLFTATKSNGEDDKVDVSQQDQINKSSADQLLLPVVQVMVATIVYDTWQYFMHRYMHHNKYLYKHIHSTHHRLIVPYTFGALYNHPLEGLLMDTVGGAICYLVTGMSPRTSIYFFSFATIKGVDDHCGLWFPSWNPFHAFCGNNSAYHYIHHQLYGTKYNFSQPFFSVWDRVLGTHMPYVVEKRKEGGYEVNRPCCKDL